MLNEESFKQKIKLESWQRKMLPFFKTKEAFAIYEFLKARSKAKNVILPSSDKTFDCFNYCEFDDVKIVVIGQEPYPQVVGGKPVADGLAFSCSQTEKAQPSLEYLHHSIRNNYFLIEHLPNDLRYLAKQGIIWLNYSLTVELNKIGSHVNLSKDMFPSKNLWEEFIKYFLQDAMWGTSGIIYILMGKEATKAAKYINPLGNYILQTEHPSYAARNNDDEWNAGMVWKKANDIITQNNGLEFAIKFDPQLLKPLT